MFFILFLSILNFIPMVALLNCTVSPVKYEFHKVGINQKSPRTIIVVKNFGSVEKCAEFTRYQGGLAFNYATFEKIDFLINPLKSKVASPSHGNCEVLDCPEVRNLINMIHDTRYEYYSSYLNPNKTSGLVCASGIGVFKFHAEHKNYTNALKSCEDNGGTLADILTSDRTTRLSKILTKTRHAWIGLREMERKQNYISSHEKSINCFRYRAWYPGHPKTSADLNCVVLTNSNSWKTMDCNAKFPYICEIFISGIPNNLLV